VSAAGNQRAFGIAQDPFDLAARAPMTAMGHLQPPYSFAAGDSLSPDSFLAGRMPPTIKEGHFRKSMALALFTLVALMAGHHSSVSASNFDS
jgi:hypothetical protein